MTYRNKSASKPQYMPIDSDTVLCYRFQESSAPFANLGTQGSADMTAESGEGTVWLGGQPDNAFGKALKFSMVNTGSGGIRASNFTFPTTNITVSCWVTPTRLLGAVSIGRIFFKSYYPASWSAPYVGMEIAFNSTNSGLTFTQTLSGGAQPQVHFHNDYRGVQLYTRHHLGYTYGDGSLKAYLNGMLIGSNVVATALDLGTGPWCIGRTVSSSSNEHCGMILHEVRVDQVIRDANWFKQVYELGK